MHQLRYGRSSILELNVPEEELVANCTGVRGTVIEDPAAAAAAVLASPLNFPPLDQAVVPGDQVVVPVDPEVPQAGNVVAGVIHALLEAEVQPDQVSVLLDKRHADVVDFESYLPPRAEGAQLVVHEPDDPSQLAYLAASKDATPIRLNRLLCDADLVLPINLVRPDWAFSYAGPHGALCPTFSDAQIQQRFRTPNTAAPRKHQQRRREEADEVAWLLGIQLTLQVIAGPGDTVLQVLAGLDEDVSREGQRRVRAAWDHEVTEHAELVIATIAGGPVHQSWDNFGRALHAAQQVCASGGTIVLCTDLACPPGPALQRLASLEDNERLMQRLGSDRSEDATAAWLLSDARDQSHVFLLSQLEQSVVESLGIGYIDDPRHISRIRSQHDSCILLTDAHRR